MNKPIYNFFTKDHKRVDDLLAQATRNLPQIDMKCYDEFRIALLTHIKLEENLLFPTAKEANGGHPLPHFKRFRLEHGALTTLIAVYPTPDLIKVISHVLQKHDEAEEEPGGMYDVCEALTKEKTDEVLQKAKRVKPVPVHPPKKEAYVLEAAKRVLSRAGYDYEEILNLPLP